MERKVHVTVMLDPHQLVTLDELSIERKKSKSGLIGEALSRYLRTLERSNSVVGGKQVG